MGKYLMTNKEFDSAVLEVLHMHAEKTKHEMPLLTPEMTAAVDASKYISSDKRFRNENPMVQAYGKATVEGATCRSCARLHRSGRRYKCFLRHTVTSDGGDHRVNWPACSKYEGGCL